MLKNFDKWLDKENLHCLKAMFMRAILLMTILMAKEKLFAQTTLSKKETLKMVNLWNVIIKHHLNIIQITYFQLATQILI